MLESKKKLAFGCLLIPLLVACGGGDGDAPAGINVPQCSAGNCGSHGVPTPQQPAKQAALCPADQDIGRSTYTGGAGSGEILSLKIDAIAMRYELKWFESPIPMTTGTVTPTRAGVTITGAVQHPAPGRLATAEQRRCAFVLMSGSGNSARTQTAYSTKETFNAANPPTIFVGFGVAGGGIPGTTLQYDGQSVVRLIQEFPLARKTISILTDSSAIDTALGYLRKNAGWGKKKGFDFNKYADTVYFFKSPEVQGILKSLMRPEVSREIPLMVGQVMRRDFDFYPFIGFSNISEGSGALRGQYNGVIYHLSSSRGYSVGAGAFSEIFDGNECRSGYKKGEKPFVDVSGCIGKGGAWVKNEHGYFDGAGAPQIVAPFQFPISSKTLTDMAGRLREFSEKSVLLKNNYGFDWWLSADQQKENKLIDDIAKSMNKLADYFEKASAKWAPRKIASSHMVLGQLNGKTIPIIVRTGAVNPGSAANGYLDTEVDDESGIAILAPAEAIPASMLDGNYVGADSNFSYTATYFKGSAGIFSDPMTLQSRDRVTLDYDKQAHGLIDISLLDQSRKVSGHLISVGGIYAALMNGTVNGGMSDSASKIGTPPYVLPAESAPYFVVGAKVGQ